MTIVKKIGHAYLAITLEEMAAYMLPIVPKTVAAENPASYSVPEIGPVNFMTQFAASLMRCPPVTYRSRNSARSPSSGTFTPPTDTTMDSARNLF